MTETHPKLIAKHLVIHNRIPFPLASPKLKSASIVFINLQVRLLGVKHLIRLVDAVA